MDEQQPTIRDLVLEALGEASMCWSLTPPGVFDSVKAIDIAERLLTAIADDKAQAIAAMQTAQPAPAKPKKADTPFIGRNGG